MCSNPPTEAPLGTIPNSSTLTICRCEAFTHIHEEIQRDNLEGRADKVIYIGNEHEQRIVYFVWFSERCKDREYIFWWPSFFSHKTSEKIQTVAASMKTLRITEVEYRKNDFVGQLFWKNAQRKKADVNDNGSQELNHLEEDYQGIVEKLQRRSTCRQKESSWFKMNALLRTFTEDAPSMIEALDRNDKEAWKKPIRMKVGTLQQMGRCWYLQESSRYAYQVRDKKEARWRRKRGEEEAVRKDKVHFVVRRNQEVVFQGSLLSPISHKFVNNFMFGLSIQKGWRARHNNFYNAFINRQLERVGYVQMHAHVLSKSERGGKVCRLRKRVYGLKDAARTCSKLMLDTLSECCLKEMDIALFVSVNGKAVVLCNVDDLTLFPKDNS